MVHSSRLFGENSTNGSDKFSTRCFAVGAFLVANAVVVLRDVVALPLASLPSELAHQQIDHLADRLDARDTPLSHSW